MADTVTSYLHALWVYWWAFMMGGPLIIDESFKWVFPRFRDWLSKKLKAEQRRRIEVGLMMFGIFLAGFLAFSEEHAARGKAEAAFANAPRIIMSLAGGAVEKIANGDVFAKVLVTYKGPGNATCGMFLDTLHRDGDAEPIFKDRNFQIGAETGGTNHIDNYWVFSDGNDHYYNVAWIPKGTNKLGIQSLQYNQTFPAPLLKGVYELIVKTQGENCPSPRWDIWIRYGGGNDVAFIADKFKPL